MFIEIFPRRAISFENPLVVTRKPDGRIMAYISNHSSSDGLYPLAGHDAEHGVRWWISGHCFAWKTFEKVSPADCIKGANADPRKILEKFWGSYFVVMYDGASGRFTVLRGPCADREIYYIVAADGGCIIGDCPEELFRAIARKPAPDLSYLRKFLQDESPQLGETAWQDLRILPPCMYLEIQNGRGISLHDVQLLSADSPPAQGMDGLIDVISAAVRASLATRQCRAVLFLSGGLDSTLLAVALRHAERQDSVEALTFVDNSRAPGDEVEMARAVARACGMRHHSYDLNTCLPFAPARAAPFCASPGGDLCFLGHFESLQRSGFGGPSVTKLSGHGGDAIFMEPPPMAAPLDAMSRGRMIRASSAVVDLAILYRVPLWRIFSKVISEIKALQANARRFGWPLAFQPARRQQLANLAATYRELGCAVRANGGGLLYPLLAGPVVRVALASRPEDFFSRHFARTPIRIAVDRELNLPSVWRRDKGDTTHWTLRGICVHARSIRERCLDGYCVREGLVDPQKVEASIRRTALGRADLLRAVVNLYAVETMLRGRERFEQGRHVA